MWPEKVMTRGRTATNAVVYYAFSPLGSNATYTGETWKYSGVKGEVNIVHATNSKNYKPSRFYPIFHRFEATEVEQTGDSDVVTYTGGNYKSPNEAYNWKTTLSGPIAAAFCGNSVPSLLASPIYSADRYNSVVGPSIRQATERFNSPNLMGGVAAFEGLQTLRMLASPMKGLQKLASHWVSVAKARAKGVKGRNTSNKKLLDALSETWLEYRYGIMPLIYDLSALIEGYRSRRIEYNTLNGKSSLTVTDFPVRNQYTDWILNVRFLFEERRKIVAKAKTVLAYRDNLQASPWEWALWQNGFSPSQLPQAVWELVTLSFVVDWFIDVGGFITSLQHNPVRDFLAQCTSYKEVTERKRYFTGVQCYYSAYPQRVIPKCSWTQTYQTLIRRVDEDVSLGAGLINPSMSWKRQVDALTLLWGRQPNVLRSRIRL
jgi:hypothetical protein